MTDAQGGKGKEGLQSALSRTVGQLSGLNPAWLLIGALGIFWGLSTLALSGETSTCDEFVHLPAGYTYLTRHDFRLNPEHPPLAKIWAALPLLFQDVRDPEGTAWDRANQEEFGYRFFYQSGNRPEPLLRSARVMVLFWGGLILCTVYGLAKELYGPAGALVALAIATFCPPLLAHGHLVTMDAALAAMFLLSIAAYRLVLSDPGPRTSIYLGFMLGGLLCVKFVSVILFPALAWVTLVVWRAKGRMGPETTLPPCSRGQAAACTAVTLVVAFLVVWGMYGFRFDAAPGFHPEETEVRTASPPIAERILLWALDARLLPESFLNGFLFQLRHNTCGHVSYAFGHRGFQGWWWFFPAVLLIKTPVPTLLLSAWGVAAAVRRYWRGDLRESLLLVPLGFYTALALAGNINLGVRLILPIFPVLAVLSGGTVTGRVGRWFNGAGIAIPGTLAAASALGTLLAAPYFLAYFNSPSLLLKDRHEMLADSDLDWGQDLGRLEEFVRTRNIEGLKLAYFGCGSPRSLGLRHERFPVENVYHKYEPEWREAGPLRPGDWLAVSASHRIGLFPGPGRDYFSNLVRGWKPVAVIGQSIFVYQVPEGVASARKD